MIGRKLNNPFAFKNHRIAWGAVIWFGLMFIFGFLAVFVSFLWMFPEYVCGFVAWRMTFSWLDKRRKK